MPKPNATKTPKSTNGKTRKGKAEPARPVGEVVYPEIKVKVCSGPNAVTVTQMKRLLGWTPETEGLSYGDNYTLIDVNGVKVRCLHNAHNRPFKQPWSMQLAQEILNKHWSGPNGNGKTINGEAIIVGKYEEMLSGQHRGIGLIQAGQLWAKDMAPDGPKHWAKNWPTEPVLDSLVVFGVDEDSSVTRTLDNVMPRDLTDVLYTSGFFPTLKGKDRQKAVSALDHAVRLLWHRTGAGLDAFSPKRTHSEALEFIERHGGMRGKIVEAVSHILAEDADGAISKRYAGPGTAAGLMYLMAACNDDGDKYREGSPITAKPLKFKDWEQAEGFWRQLGTSKVFEPLRQAFKLAENPVLGVPAPVPVRLALLVNGWNEYISKGQLPEEPEDLLPDLGDADQFGRRPLRRVPKVGGIDLGDPEEKASGDKDAGNKPPTQEPAKGKGGKKTDEARRKEAEELNGKLQARRAEDGKTLAGELAVLRQEYPDVILLFKIGTGYRLWEEDATEVARMLKAQTEKVNNLTSLKLTEARGTELISSLLGKGHRVAVVTVKDGATSVNELDAELYAAEPEAEEYEEVEPDTEEATDEYEEVEE